MCEIRRKVERRFGKTLVGLNRTGVVLCVELGSGAWVHGGPRLYLEVVSRICVARLTFLSYTSDSWVAN